MTRELLSAKMIFVNEYSDPLSVMNRLFAGWWCRDRFGFLNKYSPIRASNEIDPVSKQVMELGALHDGKTINQIINERAQDILRTDKPIAVSWSGGVDSTLVAIALLNNGLPTSDLTIICAESSKEEYPFLYKWFKNNNVNFIEDNKVQSSYEKFDGVIVTGWCADQLFGSDIHVRNPDYYNLPWIDGLKLAFKDRGINLSDKSFDVLNDVYQEYASLLGLKLEQFCEFAWLYNFGCKWTYVSQESQLSHDSQKVRDRFIPFFETIDFQRYSLRRFNKLREVNVNKVNKFYKRPLKKYIYAFLNDPAYLNSKGKKNSWALTEDVVSRVGVLDTDGYRQFRFKGIDETAGVNFGTLSQRVRSLYLKNEQ